MGLCVELQDENGKTLEVVTDEKNFLHKLLPPHDDDSNPMLASIDWYGDTVFNELQMKRFLAEWERLADRARTPEEQALVAAVRALALRCREAVHLYLKFLGD